MDDWQNEMLSPAAREILIKAAEEAQKLPEDSLQRKLVIERAIDQARAVCPGRFRDDAR